MSEKLKDFQKVCCPTRESGSMETKYKETNGGSRLLHGTVIHHLTVLSWSRIYAEISKHKLGESKLMQDFI